MTHRNTLLALATVALFNASASAADLLVPSLQFPTIQSAVDAAFPGDKVRIADGVYDEGVFVQGKFNVAIKGDDDVFVRMIHVDACSSVSVKEITYMEASDYQLFITNSNDIDVRFCSFQNGASGVGIFDSAKVNVRDSDLMFLGTGIAMSNGQNCRFAVAALATQVAMNVQFSKGTLIEECPLKNAGEIFIYESPFTTVRSNSFKATRLSVASANNLLVEGNKFKKSEFAAIYLENVTNSTIQGNAMKKVLADGAFINGGGGNFFFANKIKKSGDVGIRIASTGNSLDQNMVKKSAFLDLVDHTGGNNSYGFNLFGTSNL